MCSAITTATTGLYNITKGVCNGVTGAYAFVGRKIEQLSQKVLPESVVKITKQAYDSLPYTAISLAVLRQPYPVTLAILTGYFVAHIYKEQLLETATYKNLWHGAANATLFTAIQHTAQFVITKNPGFALCATIGIITAKLMHRHAEALAPVIQPLQKSPAAS